MTEEYKQSAFQKVHGRILNEYKDNKEMQDFLDKAFNGPDDKHKVIVFKDSEPESDIDRLSMDTLMQLGVLDKISNKSKQSEELNQWVI